MSTRADDLETEPHSLDGGTGPKAQVHARTFASTVAGFFGKNGGADVPEPKVARVDASELARREQASANATLYQHWAAIRAQGITASEFIAFLQPLADLDGITVSYIYSDEDGVEHVYNHRRSEVGTVNPLSRAIQEKKLSKEKALSFALNEEGRVWIESNFMELT